MVLLPKFELIGTLKLIGKLKPTVMPGVPTLFNAMLRHTSIKRFDLSSLEFCISGGAALPVDVKRGFEALTGCSLVEGYGLSETSPVATCNPLDVTREGSIGLPLPATEISIRSLEDPTEEVARGEPGELCTRGYSVMLGYWDAPERTAEAIDRARWMHTGDLATMDDEGYVKIVGRSKDMIIRGGYNVYPVEVENHLGQHPAIDRVAVVGTAAPVLGEIGVAFVVPSPGSTPDLGELRGWCKERLADYKAPDCLVVVDELPLTPMSKIDKRALAPAAAEAEKAWER